MKRMLFILAALVWSCTLRGAEIALPHIVFFVDSGIERTVEDTGGEFTVEFGTASNLSAAEIRADINDVLNAGHWYWLTVSDLTLVASATGRATFAVNAHSEAADFTFRLYDSSRSSYVPVRQLARTDHWIENAGTHEIYYRQQLPIRVNKSVRGETYTLRRDGADVAIRTGDGGALTFYASEPGTYTVAAAQTRIRGEVAIRYCTFLTRVQITPLMDPVLLPGDAMTVRIPCSFDPNDAPDRDRLDAMFADFSDGKVPYWNPNIRLRIVSWHADRFELEIAGAVNPGDAITNDTHIRTSAGTLEIRQSGGGQLGIYNVSISVEPEDELGEIMLSGSDEKVYYLLFANGGYLMADTFGTGEALYFGRFPTGCYKVQAHMNGVSADMVGDSLLLARPHGSTACNVVRSIEYTDAEGRFTTDMTYCDGLGYPVQQIAVRASGERDVRSHVPNDVVVPIRYDRLRRDDAQTYLPYVAEGYEGVRQDDPFGAQRAFYSAAYADTCAYAATDFERSPAGRPLRIQQPGQAFRSAERCARFVYASNTAGDSVRRLRVAADGALTVAAPYAPGTLARTAVTDEDGNRIERFSDARQRLLLERRRISETAHADTYFVYDDRDSLRWVVSPEGSARLSAARVSPDDSLAFRYCYVYTYDGRGNIVEKRLSGCGAQRFVYDAGDRLVASQSGNDRTTDSWTLHAYDALGRETARYRTDGWSAEALREQLRDRGAESVAPKTLLAETCYDTYPADCMRPSDIPCDVRTHGLKTGERLRIDDTDSFVARTFFYDRRGLCIRSVESGAGLTRTTDTEYDFKGNVVRICEIVDTGTAIDSLTVRRSYDDRGRLLQETASLDGCAPATVTCRYDGLGRLAEKRFGEAAPDIADTFGYDLRGRLTHRKNREFEMSLRYHDPEFAASTPSYTGNISEWTWKHRGRAEHTYAFAYDGLSRLTGAVQYIDGERDDRFVERGLSYDRNGNIGSLQRTENGAVTDRLTYAYDGNRLASLSGTTNATYGYDACGNMTRDGAHGLELSYNRLNLIEKVMCDDTTSANYSYLADGTKLAATDAAGDGLVYAGSLVYRKQDGAMTLESAAFSGGRLMASQTAAGTTFTPQYHLTDHLGSTRVVVNADGDVLERNDYYPFGLRWTDSGSLISDNRYRYNGKEEQDFVNVPLVDYGARMYDAKYRMSWNAFDPLAETYYPITPYAYCANNPAKYIDTDGKRVLIVINDQNRTITIAANIYLSSPYYTKKQLGSIAETYQRDILNAWDQNWTYKNKDTEYQVRFNVNVIVGSEKKQSTSYDNFIEVQNDESSRSYVRYTFYGKWIARGDVAAHEFGHIAGLKDRYIDKEENGQTRSIPNKNWETNIMGAEKGIVEQRNIDDILKRPFEYYNDIKDSWWKKILFHDANRYLIRSIDK